MLYLAYVIRFCIRLNDWDDSTPGQCYNASRIALPNSLHPHVDRLYVGITSLYSVAFLITATVESRRPNQQNEAKKVVIVMGSLQFVLHVYTAISLFASNQSLLDNPAIEEKWGFGQILAVVMLGATVIRCGTCLEGIDITSTPINSRLAKLHEPTEYYSWRKKHEKLTSTPDENAANTPNGNAANKGDENTAPRQLTRSQTFP